MIVHQPGDRLGLVNFRLPSDVRSLLFGPDGEFVCSAAHRGRPGGVHGHCEERARTRHEDRAFIEAHARRIQHISGKRDRDGLADDVIRPASTGVDQATIERIAEHYIAAKDAVIGWAMGITHHLNGVQNVQALANLSLLRGMVGRPRAGLMPIPRSRRRPGERLGRRGLPRSSRRSWSSSNAGSASNRPNRPVTIPITCLEAAGRGEMDTAICFRAATSWSRDPLHSSPPGEAGAEDRPGRLPLDDAQHGTRLGDRPRNADPPRPAPRRRATARNQESMFSFVRMSEGGKPRFAGPRSEVSILSAIGRDLLAEQNHVD